MKKPVFYKELSYVFGLLILVFATALTERADFGMSMVVAPAYILHLKLSQVLPWFSYGVAAYVVQGVLLVIMMLILRRFRLSYLFSFVTAVLYGILVDWLMAMVAYFPADTFAWRLLWYVLGTVLCSFSIALLFHTYLAPEAYDLFVKELSRKFGWKIDKVKTCYDCASLLISVILSFSFFGFGQFQGVKLGTLVCALVNGFLIGQFSKLLEKHFDFQNRFGFEKYFL